MAGFANGVCEYDFVAEYGTECDVQESTASIALSGNCDLDVNECDSSPCQNDAACSDSTTNDEVSYHAYRCTCAAGFANGACEYDFITEFTDECSVMESQAPACVDDASWTDSTGTGCDGYGADLSQGQVPCGAAGDLAGADGRTAVEACCVCQEAQPEPQMSGNCDIDVDECSSGPCQNGATCTESSVESSVSFHAYQCTCVAGFANGVCKYDGDAR